MYISFPVPNLLCVLMTILVVESSFSGEPDVMNNRLPIILASRETSPTLFGPNAPMSSDQPADAINGIDSVPGGDPSVVYDYTGVPPMSGQEYPPLGVPPMPGQEDPSAIPRVPPMSGQEYPPLGVPPMPGQEDPSAIPGVPSMSGQEYPPPEVPGMSDQANPSPMSADIPTAEDKPVPMSGDGDFSTLSADVPTLSAAQPVAMSGSPQACVFSCFGKSIGYYADIPSGCTGVWYCSHNVRTGTVRYLYGACLNNTVYDQSQLRCVPQNKAKIRCNQSPRFFPKKQN